MRFGDRRLWLRPADAHALAYLRKGGKNSQGKERAFFLSEKEDAHARPARRLVAPEKRETGVCAWRAPFARGRPGDASLRSARLEEIAQHPFLSESFLPPFAGYLLVLLGSSKRSHARLSAFPLFVFYSADFGVLLRFLFVFWL